ncbi:MAG: transglycosylase SLT domain-containing protein [Pseudomonadales bacterium]
MPDMTPNKTSAAPRLWTVRLSTARLPTLLLSAILLSACTANPPDNTSNVCSIFKEKRGWYKDARKSSRRWNADIAAMMAIIHQESSFKARAKPPRKRILWIIPGRRPASAYGYSQAIDATWEMYQRETGRDGADRNDFDDAVDFVGWYNDTSRRRNRIAKEDAYNLYLAYHEGHGGYAKQTYKNKQWLKDVAQKVASRAKTYRTQLGGCEKKLNRGFLSRLFGRG